MDPKANTTTRSAPGKKIGAYSEVRTKLFRNIMMD